MDKKGFYNYAGSVVKLPCFVEEHVFSNINETQSYQTFGFLNKEFGEVGWFYCSGCSNAIDKYVTYNYELKCLDDRRTSRTAWLDEAVFLLTLKQLFLIIYLIMILGNDLWDYKGRSYWFFTSVTTKIDTRVRGRQAVLRFLSVDTLHYL